MKRFIVLFFGLMMTFNSVAAETYTVGVLAKQGVAGFYEKWLMHGKYLSEALEGARVKIVPLKFVEVDDAVKNRTVDFVVVNSSMFVNLRNKYGAEALATLIKTNMLKHKSDTFGGVIFTAAGSGEINSLQDVKGKSFIAVKNTSLGGYQMALKEFLDNGIELATEAESVSYADTHNNVVTQVLKTVGTIGTVRTDTLEQLQHEGKISMEQIKVLNKKEVEGFPYVVSTALYPEWPFAAMAHVPAEVKAKISDQLMALPENSMAATTAGIIGWSKPKDYDSVSKLLEQIAGH